ncbi:MAG: protein kinase family protein [Bacillus sp. (in: Bacteria)]|nr:protein kinase family protein [Bacillus sp. (in: firmicutes)]
MMNNISKNPFKFSRGTVVSGKWHHNKYTIVKELGFGANGTVYLAQSSFGYVALKMSNDHMTVTSEVNVLKAFSKVQGSALGPSLLDVDDWQRITGMIPFYVMEYIQGEDLLTFIQKKGTAWIPVLLSQLLRDLERLHKEGWVFGDIKPENLIVTQPSNRIRCIDVGGTTPIGRAVKEFTEFFDRGYWGYGTRKAEPSYDLFSVAMVIVNIAYPRRFQKQGDGKNQLLHVIKQSPTLQPYRFIIFKALHGQYRSAEDMRRDILTLVVSNQQPKGTARRAASRKQPASVSIQSVRVKKTNQGGWLESFLVLTLVSVLYALYIFQQLL